MRQMSVIALLLLAGAGVGLPQQRRGGEPEAPQGPGRELMLAACVQCHDVQIIAVQRKTRDAWRRTVNEMIWRGAPLLADEVDTLARYLAASFGPGTKPGGAKP